MEGCKRHTNDSEEQSRKEGCNRRERLPLVEPNGSRRITVSEIGDLWDRVLDLDPVESCYDYDLKEPSPEGFVL
jgi:hypothetical protein